MAEPQTVRVRSNIGALDESVFRDVLREIINELAKEGAELMRMIAPHRTGALAEHIEHDSERLGNIDVARVGVTRVLEAAASSIFSGGSDSSYYPLFVEKGTGIFGDTRSPITALHMIEGPDGAQRGFMRWEDHGMTFIAKEVKGQHPQPFVAETYAAMRAMMRAKLEEWKARVTADLETRKRSLGAAEEIL